jgi:hypothetical protein
VLKLVSSIVHELWASNDTSPLILPGNVPLDATTVNTDLTQYLEDQWKPIIDSDIDGPGSTAQQIDLDRPNLGQRFVTQRIARSIFMGAAPRIKSSRKGLDKQYLWLGTAIPGDTLGNFGSAVELLAQRSTYFYEEQGHYWFDTQPSVTKTANDYAERLREDVETVWNEISRRLQGEEKSRGVFDRVHIAPSSSADIPDLEDTRLVIAHPRHARRKQDGADSAAHAWVRDAIESKGASQRIHRNTLIFLLADKSELESLEAATRSYLGWKRVQATSDSLNLSAQQRKQTDDWVGRLDQTVSDRIRDTFVWAIYPEQFDPTKPFEVIADRVPESGGRSLAERVGTKLGREDQLVTDFGAPILGATLRGELGALWRDAGEISVGELWGYFTRYTYLPRLVRREVLDGAIQRWPPSLSTANVSASRQARTATPAATADLWCRLTRTQASRSRTAPCSSTPRKRRNRLTPTVQRPEKPLPGRKKAAARVSAPWTSCGQGLTSPRLTATRCLRPSLRSKQRLRASSVRSRSTPTGTPATSAMSPAKSSTDSPEPVRAWRSPSTSRPPNPKASTRQRSAPSARTPASSSSTPAPASRRTEIERDHSRNCADWVRHPTSELQRSSAQLSRQLHTFRPVRDRELQFRDCRTKCSVELDPRDVRTEHPVPRRPAFAQANEQAKPHGTGGQQCNPSDCASC